MRGHPYYLDPSSTPGVFQKHFDEPLLCRFGVGGVGLEMSSFQGFQDVFYLRKGCVSSPTTLSKHQPTGRSLFHEQMVLRIEDSWQSCFSVSFLLVVAWLCPRAQ